MLQIPRKISHDALEILANPQEFSTKILQIPGVFHWEIKGRFRKRVVLANVPSFRFSFRGNIRRNHPFGNHPFVNTKKGYWEIKGRFPKGWFWRTCPRSGFRSGGTSAKTTLLETTLLRTPEFLQHPTYKIDRFPLNATNSKENLTENPQEFLKYP